MQFDSRYLTVPPRRTRALTRSLTVPVPHATDKEVDYYICNDTLSTFLPPTVQPERQQMTRVWYVFKLLCVLSNFGGAICSVVITSWWQQEFWWFYHSKAALIVPEGFPDLPIDVILEMFKYQQDHTIYLKTDYGLTLYMENKLIWILALLELVILILFTCLRLAVCRDCLDELAGFSSFQLLRLWNPHRFMLNWRSFKYSYANTKSRFKSGYVLVQVLTLFLALLAPLCFVFRMKYVSAQLNNLSLVGLMPIFSTILNIHALFK